MKLSRYANGKIRTYLNVHPTIQIKMCRVYLFISMLNPKKSGFIKYNLLPSKDKRASAHLFLLLCLIF